MVTRQASFATLLVSLSCLAMAGSAVAGERLRHHGRHDGMDRHHVMKVRIPSYNIIPGTGTYSGSIRVFHVAGIGTSTYLEGSRGPVLRREPVVLKIINVDSASLAAACSMEAGVCVIRP
jgi:hypothetical protein